MVRPSDVKLLYSELQGPTYLGRPKARAAVGPLIHDQLCEDTEDNKGPHKGYCLGYDHAGKPRLCSQSAEVVRRRFLLMIPFGQTQVCLVPLPAPLFPVQYFSARSARWISSPLFSSSLSPLG